MAKPKKTKKPPLTPALLYAMLARPVYRSDGTVVPKKEGTA